MTDFLWILLYFAICAAVALTLRFTVHIPDEVFRKLLHLILLGSLAVWTAVFELWYTAAISAIVFAIAVYPILMLAERLQGYSEVVTERKSGELKRSLLLVFFMFASVTAICRGIFADRYLTLAAIYAWGFGDAAAALIGKRFGKHRIPRVAGGKKSLEGTLAMLAVSFISVLIVLILRGGMSLGMCTLTAICAATVSSTVELVTDGGYDTLTCPLAAMAVIIPLVYLTGGGI